jgi:hypothetical protein
MNEVIKTRRNKISTTMQLLNTKCTARPAHCLHPRNYVLCKLDHSKTVRLNSYATKTSMQQYTLQSQAIAALYSPPPPVPSSHYQYRFWTKNCCCYSTVAEWGRQYYSKVVRTYMSTDHKQHHAFGETSGRPSWEKAGVSQGDILGKGTFRM